MIENPMNTNTININLSKKCNGQRINIQSIITTLDYKKLNKANPRTLAKDKIDYVLAQIESITGENVSRELYKIYCEIEYANIGHIKQVFSPIFK